jgi:hypothetical protein
MSEYVKSNADGSQARVYTERTQTSNNASASVVTVGTVAELEAAVAAQIAGQTIEIVAGDYVLTESLTILLAATGGGLKGIGSVSITGAAAADEAVLIDPAEATATFEYSLENVHIKGGSNKIGLHVLNTNVNKKVNVYINQVDIEDNGTGKALTVVNSDGANAIRVYWNGGNVDGIAHTPKDTGDRLVLRGVNIEENLVTAVVDVVASYFFSNCKLPHEGMTGGHANNVISTAYCWTEAVEFVPVLVDASDFPGAFSATIVGA